MQERQDLHRKYEYTANMTFNRSKDLEFLILIGQNFVKHFKHF